VHNVEVVKALRAAVASGSMPHLLLYGPPGTGKTSTVLALARELFGGRVRDCVLEVNASDDRGIDMVRKKIRKFAMADVVAGTFKLVVLDEADCLTPDAQSALRCLVEKATPTTRFCFLCNYSTKIIDPLASRCAKYRFAPIPATAMGPALDAMARAEGLLDLDPEVLRLCMNKCQGDMRRTITCLQAMCAGGSVPTLDCVQDALGLVPALAMDSLWHCILVPVQTYLLHEQVQGLVLGAYSLASILDALLDLVLAADSDDLDDRKKAAMCQVLAEADKRVCDGCDDGLQLLHVATALRSISLSHK
jgi:replication factor C subunit 2/4